MSNFKKMILGEEMPDREDPKYRERYEKDVEAGRRFAKATRIDKVAGGIQKFATEHSRLFLVIVFGFVTCCLALNIYHMTRAYSVQHEQRSATQTQEMKLREKLHKSHTTLPIYEGDTKQD